MRASPKAPTSNQTMSQNTRSAILSILLLLASSAVWAQGTITPSPFQVVLDNSGNIVNNACVWVTAAGTSTPVNTYTDSALSVANTNPIRTDSAGRFTAYLSPGSSYKFVYEAACVPPAHGTVYRTADNIAATPTSANSVDVVGTAGEAITANNCVYLSDGSGAKAAGQWFKCDTANAYSSLLPTVGIALASIGSAANGTIRIVGSVSGFSSLTVGSTYYVSTAGAITATKPTTNPRTLGVADTSNSLVLGAEPTQAPVTGIVEGRLTLTSGTAVTNSDVTAATTLYYTPYKGNRISLYDGSNWKLYTFAETSIAVPATTSQMYDVFVYDNAGTRTLELTAWTNDTTRATALVLQDGVYVKSGATTRLYLGSFRTTTVSGQTEDSETKRYVWNYYNRVPRLLRRQETTASWTYTTATFRQANGSTLNQVDLITGVAEEPLTLEVNVAANNTGAGNTFAVAIGQDSTTAQVSGSTQGFAVEPAASATIPLRAMIRFIPSIGRHFYAWLEISQAAGTTNWWGTNGFSSGNVSGIFGTIGG